MKYKVYEQINGKKKLLGYFYNIYEIREFLGISNVSVKKIIDGEQNVYSDKYIILRN